MASETDDPVGERATVSVVRDAISVHNLVMLVAGVIAGYSIGVLGEDAVVVPLLGSIPGPAFGVVGIAVAIAVYRRGNCCDDCGEKGCGCAGECGDSCSYDP